MDNARNATRDYVIIREGEALLVPPPQDEIQINPECANDILVVASDLTAGEFDDIYLDTYTADSAAGARYRAG